jgi:hypothetical protein
MSQDFKTVLVTDDRIGNLSDEITYAVKKGGSVVNVYPYKAISATNSQIVFNIQVPNRSTIIDRRIMLKTTVRYTINCTRALDDAEIAQIVPSSFPVQSLFSTMSMTVNSNTVTVNINDVLPAFNNMLDSRELSRYNGACPVMRDSYYNYADSVGQNNSSFAGWGSCVDYDLATRGSYAIDSFVQIAGTNNYTLQLTCYEPLLLSPLIWGNPKSNNSGMYGVTNLTFLFNIANANRSLRFSAGLPITVALADDGIQQGTTSLFITYLTPHPSQLLSSRCVVPYMEFPRYTSNTNTTIARSNIDPADGILKPGTSSLVSQSLQLNSIPDKLLIYVRPTPSAGIPDRFLAIAGASFNWNNQSGIMSSFSQYDLWRASVDAGSNQSWNEYRGLGTILNQVVTAPAGAGACAVTYTQSKVPLIGSLLAVDMGRTLQLINDYDAAGSIGSYNLQFQLQVENYDSVDVVNPVITLITMNTGFMALENGSSSVFTAILDKATVLQTSEQETYSYSAYKRQVGGGFLDVMKHVGKALLPVARKLVSEMDHPYAKKADSALKMLGLGQHGAGVGFGAGMGFGSSGGALRRKIH